MQKKLVTLALQGGGSQGAYTWGVLDRLLQDERVEIEGISGASAGAINAVVLAHGVTVGGRAGGRQALATFWRSVASRTPIDLSPGVWGGAAVGRNAKPGLNALVQLSRFFSPYELNPLNLNPLRDILAEQLDFERIRSSCRIKLFIAATQVATGNPRIFTTDELTLDALLASACIPSLNHSVEIDGEAYWDGGLSANPPLRPLLYRCEARDMLVVLLHPLRRSQFPGSADEIAHRIAEISFGSTLASELQGIALAKKEAARALIPLGRLDRRLRRLNMHLIESEEFMDGLTTMSRLDTDSGFLDALRKEGRNRTSAWLRKNFRHLGMRSSFELARRFC
jgi:NTE family protein